MTELTIKLKDDSKLGLLLAMLRWLVKSEGVELSVEQNGQEVTLDRAADDDARFDAIVNQIIEDAISGRLEPMTDEEMDEIDRETAEWGERTAAALGITSDDDVVRIVNEYRREQRVKTAA